MEHILILHKGDINTSKLGKNYQILAENNLTLIFDEEAMEELLKDIKYLKRTLVKKRTDLQNKT
jgi:hypothetical protein